VSVLSIGHFAGEIPGLSTAFHSSSLLESGNDMFSFSFSAWALEPKSALRNEKAGADLSAFDRAVVKYGKPDTVRLPVGRMVVIVVVLSRIKRADDLMVAENRLSILLATRRD
jgi:hypothetical protein